MNHNHVNLTAALFLALFCALQVQGASSAVTPVPLDTTSPTSAQTVNPAAPVLSVLERFRTYTGPRTPAALTVLFAEPLAANISQLPEVALSDGASMVKVTISAGSPDSKAPNVAFKGAQLISLTRNKPDVWDIEALPGAGVVNPLLIVLTDSVAREILLTVAPPLPAEIDLSEKGFIAFLGGTKILAQPILDLNDDGRSDYLDDYIFTANYLVRIKSAAVVPVAAQGSSSPLPTVGQVSEPLKQTPGIAPSHSSAEQGAGSVQTPYQRNLSNRNQRAREQSERLRGKLPVPGSQSVVLPGQQ